MDIALLIRNRLKELRLDQRDLARAADVTESYISQLLTQKNSHRRRTGPICTRRSDEH